jgi:hypothetical protein
MTFSRGRWVHRAITIRQNELPAIDRITLQDSQQVLFSTVQDSSSCVFTLSINPHEALLAICGLDLSLSNFWHILRIARPKSST